MEINSQDTSKASEEQPERVPEGEESTVDGLNPESDAKTVSSIGNFISASSP